MGITIQTYKQMLFYIYFRVLSKQGSGIIQRDAAAVEAIVKACAYLHNLAIDEGLQPITRESQIDPDMEPLLAENALKYLMNAVKRNRHKVFRAHYRPQPRARYEAGLHKRNQILREQFRDRTVKIGKLQQRRRGRPRLEACAAPAPRRGRVEKRQHIRHN